MDPTNRPIIPRPVNLNFFTIYFPITAYISILHRISGVLIFFLIPSLLWLLQESLVSESSWDLVHTLFHITWFKVICWVSLSGLIYHWIAGIRHLLLDVHLGETKKGGKIGSIIVLFLSGLSIFALGVWLWF